MIVRHWHFFLAIVATAVSLSSCAMIHVNIAYHSSSWHGLSRAPDQFSSFAFSDGTHGWAVSLDSPGVLSTENGGQSWQLCNGRILGVPTRGIGSLPSKMADLPLPAQVLSTGGKVFVAYYAQAVGTVMNPPPNYLRSGILVSSDGGAIWHQCLSLAPSKDSVLYLTASDPAHLWALCASGNPDQAAPTYLLRSTDGGSTWSRVSVRSIGWAGAGLASPSLVFVDPSHGWSMFVPYSNGVALTLRTTRDGGEKWTVVHTPYDYDEDSLFALDARHAWFATGDEPWHKLGALYSTADGGKTWHRDHTFDHISLSGVFFTDSRQGWVVTSGQKVNAIYATSDGGRHWREELTSSNGDWSPQAWTFQRAAGTLFASNGYLMFSRLLPQEGP